MSRGLGRPHRAGAQAAAPASLTVRAVRALLFLLPLALVAFVGASFFLTRGPERWAAAKLYAYPAEHHLIVRARVVAVQGATAGDFVGAVRLHVDAAGGQRLASAEAPADARGVAEFSYPGLLDTVPGKRITLLAEAADSGASLARAELMPEHFEADTAETRGGWVEGHEHGALKVAVGVRQGVLAVPFPAQLLLSVTRGEAPVGEARLLVRASGAEGVGGAENAVTVLIADAQGRAPLTLLPREHTVELLVAAFTEKAPPQGDMTVLFDDVNGQLSDGRWFGRLPVVPGASTARRVGDQLTLTSPVPRERLYVDLLTGSEPLQASAVALAEQGGVWRGQLDLPERAVNAAELTALVSSEPDMQAMALVGWPISEQDVRPAVVRRPRLVVDGVAVERARRTQAAASQRVRLGGGALLGAGLEGALFLLLTSVLAPREDPRLSAVSARGRFRWVALICVLLGLGGLSTLLLW